MRFLHCADIHLGGAKYLPDSFERTIKAIHDIFSIAKENSISTVVIAGDIFDEGSPTSKQRDAIEQILLGYDEAGYTILAISGNHDIIQPGETALRYLSIMGEVGRFKNSTIVENTTYRQIDDTIFILLVHNPRKFKQDLNKAIKGLKECSVQLEYKHVVLVAHELIQGSILDNNYKSPRGAEFEEEPFITYGAFGDVHKQQRIGPRTYYSGAPYQIKFGDDPEKGVLLVDTEDPDNPVFVPIESKKMKIVSSEDEIKEDEYGKLVSDKLELGDKKLPDNIVKTEYRKVDIELTVNFNEEGELKENVITNVIQNLEEKYTEEASTLKQFATVEIDEIFKESLGV